MPHPRSMTLGGSGGREPGGPVLGHPEPGRLLERVGGEEHQRRQRRRTSRPPWRAAAPGSWPPPPGRGPARAAYRRRGADRVTVMIDPCPGRLLQQSPAGIGPAARPACRGPRTHPVRRIGVPPRPRRGRFSSVRKLLIVLVPVILIAALAGGGIWLSQRDESGSHAGHPRLRAARRRTAGGPQHGRAGAVGTAPGDRSPSPSTRPSTTAGRHPARVASSASRSSSTRRRRHRAGRPAARRDARGPRRSRVTADGETWQLLAADRMGRRRPRSPQVARRQYVALPEGGRRGQRQRDGYDGVAQVVDAPHRRRHSTGDAAEPLYDASASPARGAQQCGDPLWSPGASDVDGADVATCFVRLLRPRGPTSPASAGRRRARSWLVVTVLPGTPTEFAGPEGTYEVVRRPPSRRVPPRRPGAREE